MRKFHFSLGVICLLLTAGFSGKVIASTTNPVITEIGDGYIAITAIGNYACEVPLSDAQFPVLEDERTFFNSEDIDYFTIVDNDGDSGLRVQAYLNSAIWDYTGTYTPGTDSVIPATNTRFMPKFDFTTSLSATPTKSIVTPITASDLEERYTFLIDGANTSDDAKNTSLYTFPDLNVSNILIGTTTPSSGELLRSQATTPMQGILRMDRVELIIPENASAGAYTNTIYITLVPGSGI